MIYSFAQFSFVSNKATYSHGETSPDNRGPIGYHQGNINNNNNNNITINNNNNKITINNNNNNINNSNNNTTW